MPQSRKHMVSSSTASSAASPEAATAATPTTISLAGPTTPPSSNHKHDHELKRAADVQPPVGYVSPLKKLKKTMEQHKRKIIDTIDELREFIQANDLTQPGVVESIRIQARLLWFAADTVGSTRVLRLFLGEQHAPEPLEQQQKEYQEAQREDEFEANQFLITLSLYDIAPDNPKLPAPRAIIAFNPTKLKLYRDSCQVQARLSGITTIDAS